jgi:hypothetical protein
MSGDIWLSEYVGRLHADRTALRQEAERLAAKIEMLKQNQAAALNDIYGAKLCYFNSMSSRAEMIRLMDSAIRLLEGSDEQV